MGVLRFDVFFFKQKTAYELRISDWSSDVCSSDLEGSRDRGQLAGSKRPSGRGAWGPPVGPGPPVRPAGAGVEGPGDYGGSGWGGNGREIGRASSRGRVCQSVESAVGAVSTKNKYTKARNQLRKA